MGTLDQFAQLLAYCDDDTIRNFCEEILRNKKVAGSLVELQIHGEVLLNRDIECLYLVDHVLSQEQMERLKEWNIDVVTLTN